MSKEKAIQPLAWQVTDLPGELPPLYALTLPAHWRTAILTLGEVDQMPAVQGLYHMIRALSAEIIHFAPNAFSSHPERRPPHWIYASTSGPALDPRRLVMAVRAWMFACYSGAQGQAVARQIQDTDLQWQHLQVASALSPLVPGLLPELVARLLLESGFELTLSNTEGQRASWKMRIVPSGPGVAELITWPPEVRTEREQPYPYSYSLKFGIGTLPGSSIPQLLCQPGITRLVGWPLVTTGKNGQTYSDLPWGHAKRVFLSREGVSWLSQCQADSYLLPLGIWRYRSGHVWAARAKDVLGGLNVQEDLPDPLALLQNPQAYPRVIIPYEPKMSKTHDVGAGLESADRFEIYEQVTEALSPYRLRPVPALTKTTTYIRGEESYNAETSRKEVPALVRRQAVTSMSMPLQIVITSSDADHWEELLREELGMGSEDHIPRLSIRQNPFPVDLAAELPENATESDKSCAGATLERVKQIVQAIPPAHGSNSGILLEMRNYQEVYHRGSRLSRRDPKTATRWGLARAGWKLQCIRPQDDSPDDYDQRIRNGVRDLLRQLDYRWNAIYPGYPQTHLPKAGGLDLLGLWVIRTNRRNGAEIPVTLPLVAYVPGNEKQVYVCLPGENGPTWVRYAEAPLLIPDYDGRKRMTSDQVRNFFVCAVRDLEMPRDTLLLLDEQNIRSAFPEIRNVAVMTADLKKIFAIGERPCRIARLRYSSDDAEVPVTYPAHNPGGKTAGVFSHPLDAGLFYSLQERPVSAKRKSGLRQRDPSGQSKPSWNPASVEILPLCLMPGDSAEAWAFVVHRLRQETYNTDRATALPEPLHGLWQLEEYIPRLDDGENSQE